MYWLKKFFSQPRNHGVAFSEVLVCCMFSLTPILVTFFVSTAQSHELASGGISELTDKGQVFLLAYGLFGPIVWLAFVHPDYPRHNARVFLGLLSVLLALPLVGFIGVDPTFSSIQNQSMIQLSFWFYGGFLIINYLLLFYCKVEPPSPEDSLRRSSSALGKAYNAEFGGKK